LIQKIYTHFKKAPGTHKLGVLYVVDSVTRQWVEAARKAGQSSGSDAPDGTFAAGVNRVTELLPVLMTDIINNAPMDQKVSSLSNFLHKIRDALLGKCCPGCTSSWFHDP
jgi:protein NRD1